MKTVYAVVGYDFCRDYNGKIYPGHQTCTEVIAVFPTKKKAEACVLKLYDTPSDVSAYECYVVQETEYHMVV